MLSKDLLGGGVELGKAYITVGTNGSYYGYYGSNNIGSITDLVFYAKLDYINNEYDCIRKIPIDRLISIGPYRPVNNIFGSDEVQVSGESYPVSLDFELSRFTVTRTDTGYYADRVGSGLILYGSFGESGMFFEPEDVGKTIELIFTGYFVYK